MTQLIVGIFILIAGIVMGIVMLRKESNSILLLVALFFTLFGVSQILRTFITDSVILDTIISIVLSLVILWIVIILWIIPLIRWIRKKVN